MATTLKLGLPLCLVIGSTETFLFTVLDADENPFDLTEAPTRLLFTVRRDIFSIDAIRKTSDDIAEIEYLPQLGATLGQALLHIVPADTIGQAPARNYIYDVWAELPGSPIIRKPLVKASRAAIVGSATSDFS